MRALPLLCLLAGCATRTVELGDFTLEIDKAGGTVDIGREGVPLATLLPAAVGDGDAAITFQSGSYLFEDESASWREGARLSVRSASAALVALTVEDADGEPIARLDLAAAGAGLLADLSAVDAADRLRLRLASPGEEPVLGGGGHAWDIDHYGEAFPLFVSEPGIGKVETDAPPADWFATGTRHASSFPQPFFLFPDRAAPLGASIGTSARVEVDLAASEPEYRFEVWDGRAQLLLIPGRTALEVVEAHALSQGAPMIPPEWAFGAWNDAIRGADRVREVAAALRASGASSSAIWTEDWKGGEDYTFGYHLSAEWAVDEELYPDPAGLAAELEAQGFAWLAYFSPFLAEESAAGAEARDLVIQTEDGEPYWFVGMTFKPTSVLDLTLPEAREWAASKMQAALDIGFDGWMTDFAEWLPPDAVLHEGDALDDHNAYPLWWQQVNAAAVADTPSDNRATFFSRSGWIGTPATSPITWAGDQRTDFSADDGLPSVIPMGLGLSVGGVAIYTHDIAGYQSIGNPPSTKELWFRWCSLGAFTPIMRTHHGAFDQDNWQFDSDEETLAHYARYTRIHAQLAPYLRGIAALAAATGRPTILHPALLFEGYPWQAQDAWMLGPSLLVAPVLEAGASSRAVQLPAGAWYDWWTGAPADQILAGGEAAAPVDHIPVFAPAGAIVPTLTVAPDTFLPNADAAALHTLAEADLERTVYVFGGAGGEFSEADGTHYSASGAYTGPGEASGSFAAGELSAGGVTLQIHGTTERAWRLVVY